MGVSGNVIVLGDSSLSSLLDPNALDPRRLDQEMEHMAAFLRRSDGVSEGL